MIMTKKDLEKKDSDFLMEFNNYLLEKCKKQWKEDKEEIYGDWDSQPNDIKARYFYQMFDDKLVKIGRKMLGIEP